MTKLSSQQLQVLETEQIDTQKAGKRELGNFTPSNHHCHRPLPSLAQTEMRCHVGAGVPNQEATLHDMKHAKGRKRTILG